MSVHRACTEFPCPFVVTSLESVVLQLQDSCHEARTENNELKQENSRMRHEFRECEKYWRALWHARKSAQGHDPDDFPTTPPSFSSLHSQSGGLAHQMAPSHMSQYGPDGIGYRTSNDPTSSMPNGPYHAGPSHDFVNQTQPMPYRTVDGDQVTVDGDQVAGDGSHPLSAPRLPKYGQYSYPMQPPNHNQQWPPGIAQASSSGGDSTGATNASSSHSPSYVESPNLTTTDMSYVSRYPVDDQKVSLGNLDTAPYVFPGSRSMSPTGSAPSSSSSPSITSQFQFPFQESHMSHDRPDFDYRRQSRGHGEVTLHGGTADISLAGAAPDAVRYRLPSRRSDSGLDRPLLPGLPPVCRSDGGSPGGRASSEGDAAPQLHHMRRPRRATAPSQTSRSPSPGGTAPPMSGTLAVIKAQAFGALRRSRTRAKKSSEREAAKVALDVLEARGMSMGVSVASGSKRVRHHGDDVEM
jgi:hypothetical protein